MDICPDCKNAKISQEIKLTSRFNGLSCPDCGGLHDGVRWYSASKYPTSVGGWIAEMGLDKNYKTFKCKDGKWRRRDVIKI